jgi:hypothetical protein
MSAPAGRDELKRLEIPLAVLGACLTGLALVFAQTGIPSWIPRAATTGAGLPSPLSGMTRSFVALASGDPGAAFRWHPLGPIVFIACVAAVVVGAASWHRGHRAEVLRQALAKRWLWWGVAAAFVGAWIRQVIWFGGTHGLL